MNELNKCYVAILRAFSTTPRENGALVLNIDNVDYPVTYGDNQVYLPLDELLEKNTIGKVFFHPACEVITSGETEIFKIIRRISSITLLTSFTKYLTVLVNIAKRKSKKSLRNDLLEMLEPFRHATDEDVKQLGELFKKMTVKVEDNSYMDNRFIYFKTVKNGRTAENERIYYKCTPTFPFYNEMNRRYNRSEDTPNESILDVCGVNISRKALGLGVHLFRTVFPSIQNPESYEYDALRSEAARFVAYCGSFALVADDMNKVQNHFRDDFDKAGVYCVDTSWVDVLENIPEYAKLIPSLDYNNHSTKSEKSQVNSAESYDIRDMMSTPVTETKQTTYQTTQNQTTGNNNEQTILFDGLEYNVTRPSANVIPLDYTYRGYQIDAGSRQVVHTAVSPTGQMYEYRFTRMGNFLSSSSSMMMGGYAIPQQPMMYAQPQQQVVYAQPQQPQVVYVQPQQQQMPTYVQTPQTVQPSVSSTTGFVTY